MDTKDCLRKVKEDRVKFISFQFSDVTGKVKSVDAPVERLEEALDNGIWFDGSSVEGFARIQESDMHLRLDTDTYAGLGRCLKCGGRGFSVIFTPLRKSHSRETHAEISSGCWQN